MSLRLVVRPAAARDITEAYNWYEEQRSGLGSRLLDAVQTVFKSIETRPSGYPFVFRDVRRVLVTPFPYSVYFRLVGEEIRVLAVIHQHRDPRVWKRRIGGG